MRDATRDEEFASFFRAHRALIRSTCFRRLGDRGAAEDATMEAFRVAWQHHNAGGELTLAWLYGVVRNIVGNEYRRVGRSKALHQKLIMNLDLDSQSDQDDSDHDDAVRDALGLLPEQHRDVLFLTYWEDLAADEVAQILGITVPAVWTRLKRARRAFAAAWSQPLTDAGEEVAVDG